MPKQSPKMSQEARANKKKRKEEKKKEPKKKREAGVPTKELKKTLNRYNEIVGKLEKGEKVSKKDVTWAREFEELIQSGYNYGMSEQAKARKRFVKVPSGTKKKKKWKLRWW